jgi:PAS domain S-box-containing protein
MYYFRRSPPGNMRMAEQKQEAFFAQTGHQKDLLNVRPFAFLEHVYEPDIGMAMDQWYTSARGDSVTYEMRWKKKPNKEHGTEDEIRDYLWTLTACVPIKTEDGTVTGIFGCNTDISAQKEATRTALRRAEAERRLASFMETAPVGVYQCDPSLNIEFCNDQWFGIIGHPKVPLEKIDWRSIIYKEDLETISQATQIVMCGEKPHTFSFRCNKIWTGPDGSSTLTWILATATGHIDKHGKVTSIIGSLTDVSQLKWSEAIQKNRVDEALESKRQQENFIDMTSHEMRTTTSN